MQCDQGKPQCQRCLKAGIACPGYRDLSEVSFRDENSRIIRRATKNDTPSSGWETVSPERSDNSPSCLSVSSQSTSSMSPGLFPRLEDIAAGFFFNKCGSDEPPLSPEYCRWLRDSYFRTKDESMVRIIEAVGLAALANIYDAPTVAASARKHYSSALTATAKRLHDPVQAGEDATLFTVIMMSIFEVSHETHMNGSTEGATKWS